MGFREKKDTLFSTLTAQIGGIGIAPDANSNYVTSNTIPFVRSTARTCARQPIFPVPAPPRGEEFEMSQNPNFVYAYAGGHVTCVDITSGREVWRTPVPGGMSFVASLMTRNDVVILGHKGMLHGLDAATGNLLWTNELRGLGYGTVFLANAGDEQARQSFK